MRGELVIVRTYGDRPEIRRIWDMDENAIYITNDEQFKLLTGGREGLFIGFPRQDVFKYNQMLAASMENLCKEKKWRWNKLTPYGEI
jgi:hypothetical protein